MPIEVTMPKLSPTMESGVLSQWLVKVGDQVKEGDLLADIETDKATMPMKAFDDGIVAHLDYAVGDEIQLGDRVLVLARKGKMPSRLPREVGAKKSGGAAKPKSAENGRGSTRDLCRGDQRPGRSRSSSGCCGRSRRRRTDQVQPARPQGRGSVAGRPGERPWRRPRRAVIRNDVELFLKSRG